MVQRSALNPKSLDLNGQWRVIHRVERSNRSRFVGLQIEFLVSLTQDGDRISGGGEKFVVDWQLARPEEASRLVIDGRIDGERVEIALQEVVPGNPQRSIVGGITWRVLDPDRMVGDFWVNLAETGGTSEAERRPRT